MIEEQLLHYGALGLFLIYMIYDRQVLMKRINDSLDKIDDRIDLLVNKE